jgi:hypothetical protein
VQRPDEAAIASRINQRFAAEVLQVQGDRVVLSVEGVRFVARLMASDQAAALLERRFAQFVVRDANSSTVVLQLLQPEQSAAPAQGAYLQALIPNLLQHAGLPVETATLAIARALLNHGLQVTPQNVAELMNTLAQMNRWGASEAEVAAALKSLGLPLSAGTLGLMQESLPSLVSLISGLREQLRGLVRGRASPQLAEQAQKLLAILESLSVEWGESGEALAEKLRQAIAQLGRPVERELAQALEQKSPNPGLSAGERSLLALALLRKEMAAEAPQGLLEKLDQLLEGMRRMQFLNSEPASSPLRGQWLRLDLPLATPGGGQPGQDPVMQNARLRVAYRGEGDAPGIDPANTRFVVRLVLATGECLGDTLEVDLSVAGKKVGALVTASSEKLQQLAESEMPSLQEGLEGLGYQLRSMNCEVGSLKPTDEVDAPGFWTSYNEVSVEA